MKPRLWEHPITTKVQINTADGLCVDLHLTNAAETILAGFVLSQQEAWRLREQLDAVVKQIEINQRLKNI